MSDIDERVQSMRRFLYIHRHNVYKIAEHVDIEPIRLYAIAGGMDFYVSELADLESYLTYHQDELNKRAGKGIGEWADSGSTPVVGHQSVK